MVNVKIRELSWVFISLKIWSSHLGKCENKKLISNFQDQTEIRTQIIIILQIHTNRSVFTKISSFNLGVKVKHIDLGNWCISGHLTGRCYIMTRSNKIEDSDEKLGQEIDGMSEYSNRHGTCEDQWNDDFPRTKCKAEWKEQHKSIGKRTSGMSKASFRIGEHLEMRRVESWSEVNEMEFWFFSILWVTASI